tara:strand:+ start:162 stop:614 length:453 start_codon:yes stop_codon:yes gene_type:complete
MGMCIECGIYFEEEEGVRHVCDECGEVQPESGSWAVEEMELVSQMESNEKYSEAADVLLQLYREATDHEYSDWPFAGKINDHLEALCVKHELVDQHIALLVFQIMIAQFQSGGGYSHSEELERAIQISTDAGREDLLHHLKNSNWTDLIP